MELHFVITGGTIDSVFDGVADATTINQNSVIQEYILKVIRPHFKYTQEIVTLKDSRQISEHTRFDILQAIRIAKANRIVVTHGTYTMPDTAMFLETHKNEFESKTVVLTGSYYPLKNFAESDAGFNLGFACASAMSQPAGVYLAMNAKLFRPNNVFKNIEVGRFVEK